MIRFQSVYFVQEVASDHGVDEAVYILEDQKAWCHSSGHEEDLSDPVLGAGVTVESFDVE